jgi:hypothetical protein
MSSRAARIEIAIFAGLVVLAAAPLFAGRYLPFFDYGAHLSVPAALRHRADPGTQVSALWDLNLGLFPNSLHYGFCYVASFLLPIETASRLFVAVFCVAALPVATAFFLRAFGRDWRLAVVAIPLAWNRCLWYGFIGFCAALPLALLLLALIERDLERPSLRRELALTLLAALLPFAHFFVTALVLLLAAALLASHAKGARPARLLRAAAPLAAAPLVIAPWFLHALRGGPRPAGGPASHLFAARPGAADYAGLLRHWFMDGYTGHADEALAIVMVLALAATFIYGRRATGAAEIPRPARVAPLIFAAVLAAAYVALPFQIRAPFEWWAMNVRVLPLLFLCLLAAGTTGELDRVGRLLLAPVAIASAAFFVYVAADVRQDFNGPPGMAGFDAVLARVPAGARVLGLYTDYGRRPRYAHYPFMYASSYAVVRGGGLAAPFTPIPQSWTNPRAVPEHPFAGDARLFQFDRHAPGFSHFIVRRCEGERCVPDPLQGVDAVRRLGESGLWRLYGCAGPPCGIQ